ncbi:hypothetical protein E4U22_004464 [Claviceps purpurea]|uniref:Uncharacterized protein n=4 Tax=Dikarya TaxID=451864 RepID=A8P462_COPC7|nr:hypothetical protein CC1G_11630 [Coprinopsis cinerea okayama7\|eukprot:XP_001838687.1 hypothetical protein CC1G_11630 [Coprinopsis cinerea okayama7\
MTTEAKIKLKAVVYWELVFDYDNSSNTGEITQSYTVKISQTSTRSTFASEVSTTTIDTLTKNNQEVDVGASYGAISANVSASWEHSEEVNNMLEKTTQTSTEDTYTVETEETRSYTIGPGGMLSLFQKHFSGPGMHVAFDVFTTDLELAKERTEIDIDVDVEAIRFVREIRVVYTDIMSEAPGDHVREINGKNPDINYGFNGKFVWLVPEQTRKTAQALTNVEFVSQAESDDRYWDLAAGAGGSNRYLIPVYDTNNKDKIYELALWRSDSYITHDKVKAAGWSGTTGDINSGRGGTYLNLVWKTRHAY